MPDVGRIRKVAKVAILVTLVFAVLRLLRGRKRPPVTGEASWPPLADQRPPAGAGPPASTTAPVASTPEPTVTLVAAEPAAGDPSSDWAEPVDGECPDGYPIKANASSKIFHVPGGQSYDRTKPERCYATEEAATADGFRKAKR